MKKCLIATKSMELGGVEKSLISLLNSVNFDEYEVDLLLLEDKGPLKSLLPKQVNIICCEEYQFIKDKVNQPPIKVVKKLFANRQIISGLGLGVSYIMTKMLDDFGIYYRYVFKSVPKLETKYDVAISYTSIIGCLTWLVKYHVQADVKIGWIHFDISKLSINKKFIHEQHKEMEKIYVVSEEAKQAFVNMFPDLSERCETKYNIVDKAIVEKMAEESDETIGENGKTRIVTVGRLTEEKGQDIIPEVALRLKEAGYDFLWFLVGEGNRRSYIEMKVEEYNLQEHVFLLGAKLNPYTYMKQADIYVQTSIHEGYCITLAEAKVFGMPIVSTEFAGAHEQLDGIENGYVVVRDAEEIGKKIKWIINNR